MCPSPDQGGEFGLAKLITPLDVNLSMGGGDDEEGSGALNMYDADAIIMGEKVCKPSQICLKGLR
jgi:hypothetical protein